MIETLSRLAHKILEHAAGFNPFQFIEGQFHALLVPDNLLSILSIVMIDLLLAGDNAVVIALAVQSLNVQQRRMGIIFGAAFAVVLRIILTFFAAKLLLVSYLKLVGGVLILWIAMKLLTDSAGDDGGHKKAGGVIQAIWMIIVADITMSTDNILAVAATAKGRTGLLIFGLGLSIPFVVFTSNLLSGWMDRHKWIIWAGAALLGKVGGEMISSDPAVTGRINAPEWATYVAQAIGIAAVLLFGWFFTAPAKKRKKRRSPANEVNLPTGS